MTTATATLPTPRPSATPTPTASPIPTATLAPLPTATPIPTARPAPTPTPTPLTTAQLFAKLSPSVAFIETPSGTGSGALIEGGYLVTNAHVVWPFDEVRVVFPNGIEDQHAQVLAMDLLGDLAIIGPLTIDIDPLVFEDGEDLAIGSDLILIGYPTETEQYPQPTITRGILSRFREWEPIEMTYFQSDAAITGGQSGGVLISETGKVIGISGLSLSGAGFALVASAADVKRRVETLISGGDVAGLGDRSVPLQGGKLKHVFSLPSPLGYRSIYN